MTTYCKRIVIVVAALLVAAGTGSSPADAQGFLDRLRQAAAGDGDRGMWRDIERHIERYDELTVRPTVRHPYVDLEIPNAVGPVYAVLEGDLFPASRELRVRVKDADPEGDRIEIDLESGDGVEGRVSFFGREVPVAVFRLWMDEIFETETPEERFERYWADPVTGVLHVRGADHSIPAGERVRYRTIDEAASHDHQLCMVCFQAPSDLIGYDEELEMQRAALAQVRREYREVPDRVAQAELQRLGEEMLADWPAPLKGYGYRFALVENPGINAFALPAGRIFVTTGLLDLFETEAELKAVLAHEIAHVESRHSRRKKTGADAGRAIGGLLGAIGAVRGDRRLMAAAAATDIVAGLAFLDYGREREREADMFASVFLARTNETDGLVGTFDKLRSARENRPPTAAGDAVTQAVDNVMERLLASHPSPLERLYRAQATTTLIFDEPPVFLGIGRNGEHVATVRFEMEQAYDDDLNVLVNISTTEALGRTDNVNDIELRTGAGRRIRLDEETAERVQPGETVSALFSSGDANSLLNEPIAEFRLRLRNVDRWVRSRE